MSPIETIARAMCAHARIDPDELVVPYETQGPVRARHTVFRPMAEMISAWLSRYTAPTTARYEEGGQDG